jgi:hypothetical protein
MNISLKSAELITYTLSIEDTSRESGVIMEILLTFQTGGTFSEEGLIWFKETLKTDLDAIPIEERNLESMLKTVQELMSETPFSYSYKLISAEKTEFYT